MIIKYHKNIHACSFIIELDLKLYVFRVRGTLLEDKHIISLNNSPKKGMDIHFIPK